MESLVKKLKSKSLNLMLKYCRGKLTDTNKLQAVVKFQVIKKVPFSREGGSQGRFERVLLHELLKEN